MNPYLSTLSSLIIIQHSVRNNIWNSHTSYTRIMLPDGHMFVGGIVSSIIAGNEWCFQLFFVLAFRYFTYAFTCVFSDWNSVEPLHNCDISEKQEAEIQPYNCSHFVCSCHKHFVHQFSASHKQSGFAEVRHIQDILQLLNWAFKAWLYGRAWLLLLCLCHLLFLDMWLLFICSSSSSCQ